MAAAAGEVAADQWVGLAGASCEQAVTQLSDVFANAGAAAHDAMTALLPCARSWDQALAWYEQARRKADEALAQEEEVRRESWAAAQRYAAIGDEARARLEQARVETYESPLRRTARLEAQRAIDQFHQATERAIGELSSQLTQVRDLVARLERGLGAMLESANRMGTARSSKGAKWFGRAGAFVTVVAAGYLQWRKDQRLHPRLDLDERISRAVTQGVTVAAGALAGGAVGGSLGSGTGMVGGALYGSPGGPVIAAYAAGGGFIVGGIAGGISGGLAGGAVADRMNDALVELIGNLGDKIDAIAPWGESDG